MRHSPTASCYVLIYVDDIIILGSSTADIDYLIASLNYFLGVEVSYPSKGGLFLSQSSYISDVLSRAQMLDAKAIATPMVSGSVIMAHQGETFSDPYLYRSIVGALQYVTLTRPEISFSVNKACQFMHSPKLIHWQFC